MAVLAALIMMAMGRGATSPELEGGGALVDEHGQAAEDAVPGGGGLPQQWCLDWVGDQIDDDGAGAEGVDGEGCLWAGLVWRGC